MLEKMMDYKKNFALIVAVVITLAAVSFGAAFVASPAFREKVVRTITVIMPQPEPKPELNETTLNLTQNVTKPNQATVTTPPPTTTPPIILPSTPSTNKTGNATPAQPTFEINDTISNLTKEQWEEINRLREEAINRTFTPNTLQIASGIVNLTEGVDDSIAKLPDNQTIYYALVLRRPVNFSTVLKDFDSAGVRFIKPFGVRGYYVYSTAESAKKATQLWYVRSVFVVPAEVKMYKEELDIMNRNLSQIYKTTTVLLLEESSEKYEKLFLAIGNISKYYHAPNYHDLIMDINGSGILELLEIDLVERVGLYGRPNIPEDSLKVVN